LFVEKHVDPIHVSGIGEYSVHPFDVTEDIPSAACDMRAAAGNVREGFRTVLAVLPCHHDAPVRPLEMLDLRA